MDMGVDETRNDIGALKIHFYGSSIGRTQSHNHAVFHCNGFTENFAAEHIQNPAVFQDQIAGGFTAGSIDQGLEHFFIQMIHLLFDIY